MYCLPSHDFNCPQLLITYVTQYMHSPAFSPHFISDVLWGLCKYCAAIIQMLLEQNMFLYDTCAKYSSYQKCYHYFRFPDALVPDRGRATFFYGCINSHYYVTHILTPFCGHLSNYKRTCSFFWQDSGTVRVQKILIAV